MERARILLQYHTGKNLSAIHTALNISRVTIYHCVHKALDMGVEAGLRDAFHRPRAPADSSLARAAIREHHMTRGFLELFHTIHGKPIPAGVIGLLLGGQSLRRAPAGEAGCSADLSGNRGRMRISSPPE